MAPSSEAPLTAIAVRVITDSAPASCREKLDARCTTVHRAPTSPEEDDRRRTMRPRFITVMRLQDQGTYDDDVEGKRVRSPSRLPELVDRLISDRRPCHDLRG